MLNKLLLSILLVLTTISPAGAVLSDHFDWPVSVDQMHERPYRHIVTSAEWNEAQCVLQNLQTELQDFANNGSPDTTCNDASVTCLFAGSASEGGPATTALALASDGADCLAGNYPLGTDASGVSQSCTPDDDAPECADLPSFTGDVTNTSCAMTIADNAVTLAKQADMATGSLIYRKTAATGDPEVQTLATLKTDLGLTGTNSGDDDAPECADLPALTGVCVSSAGSCATSITNGAVVNADLANMAALTIKGRSANSTGVPGDIACTAGAGGVLRESGSTVGCGTVATVGIADDAITLAKMDNVATSTVFYRRTAATGSPEVQTLATLKTDLGLTGTNSGDDDAPECADLPAYTGDVTKSAGSCATLITDGSLDTADFDATAVAPFATYALSNSFGGEGWFGTEPAGPDTTTYVDIFDDAFDTLNVETGKYYEIELHFVLSHTAGATSKSLRFNFGGTATIVESWIYFEHYYSTASAGTAWSLNNVGASQCAALSCVQTLDSVATTDTSDAHLVHMRVAMSVTAGGTVIPQLSWSAGTGNTSESRWGNYWTAKKYDALPAGDID